MDVTTQHALIERIAARRRGGRGTDVAESVRHVPTSAYSAPALLERERRLIDSSRNEPALQRFHRSVEQLLD